MKKSIKCNYPVERENSLGFMEYGICGKTAKYESSCVDAINKSKKDEFKLCGTHKNKLLKWVNNYKKITGVDLNLKLNDYLAV